MAKAATIHALVTNASLFEPGDRVRVFAGEIATIQEVGSYSIRVRFDDGCGANVRRQDIKSTIVDGGEVVTP